MAKKTSATSSRKADHIRINLTEDVRSGNATGLEDYSLPHQSPSGTGIWQKSAWI